jgi:hypothetical protein
MLNAPDMKEYLKILDDKAITSKEQFILTCSANGLEIDEAIYQNVIRYEIDQLTKIKKLGPMFRDLPEKSLWEYKKLFHLVESSGRVIDPKTFEPRLEVRIIHNGGIRVFSTSMELMTDMNAMFSVDIDEELFNLLKDGGLKR